MNKTESIHFQTEPLTIFDPLENAGRAKVIFNSRLFGIGQIQELLSRELTRDHARMIAILNHDRKTGTVIPPGEIHKARLNPQSRCKFIEDNAVRIKRARWIAIEEMPVFNELLPTSF